MISPEAISLFVIIINIYTRLLDANCLEGLAHCLGLHKEDITLGCRALQREYAEYPDDKLFEAYEIIDRHLQKTLQADYLNGNLGEIKGLIEDELEARERNCHSKNIKVLSCELDSQDTRLMINALTRLLYLGRIRDEQNKCFINTTRGLSENNRIAKDPLRRISRGEGYILPRIDRLIFNATLARARDCLEVYKNGLTALNSMPNDNHMWMRIYLDRVMWNKMWNSRDVEFGHRPDSVFKTHPKKAVKFVMDLPSAVDKDELAIALTLFDEIPASATCIKAKKQNQSLESRVSKFENLLLAPCKVLIDDVEQLFVSFDFDIQLKKFLRKKYAERIDNDAHLNRQRAYLHMCKKLVREKERFLEHIEQQTLVQ